MASRFLESLWYVRLCHRYNVVPSSLQPLGGGCYDPDLQVRAQKLREAEGLALGQVGGGGGGPHVAPSVYIMQAQLPPSLSPQLGKGRCHLAVYQRGKKTLEVRDPNCWLLKGRGRRPRPAPGNCLSPEWEQPVTGQP